MTPPPELMLATARAARLVSGLVHWNHRDDWLTPLREAASDGELLELAVALAVRCAHLAHHAHGEHAPRMADQFAMAAVDCQTKGARL